MFGALLLALFITHGTLAKQLCRTKYGLVGSMPWQNCTVQIGGLAIQGAAAFTSSLGPTFSTYLTEVYNQSHGLEFEALPLSFDQNFEKVSANEIDFIYSNPAAYTCMMVEFGIKTIATLVNFRKGNALSQFAGVMFTRNDSNFTTVEDLRQARVEAVSISGLGAMQLQQAELLPMGIDVMKDVKRLTFAYSQNKIVQDVFAGKADIGFVRTDMIDRSVAKNKTKWEYFRVINQINDTKFPFKRSTDFTPEWPIGSMPHVPSSIAYLVSKALMRLDRYSSDQTLSQPGILGSFATWVPPSNYLGLLGMLESINYYSPKEKRCLRSKDLDLAIRCPPGYVKRAESQYRCPDCEAGYDCLCKPCAKLNDPELELSVKLLTTMWPIDVNVSRANILNKVRNLCGQMETCATLVMGQKSLVQLTDRIGENNRKLINAPTIQLVEILFQPTGAWLPLLRENISVGGSDLQQYSIDYVLPDSAGTQLVQIRVNGNKSFAVAMSPLLFAFLQAPMKEITLASCTIGTYFDSNSKACIRCPAGQVQPLNGQTRCNKCKKGTFANASLGECLLCTPGRASDSAGMEACDLCQKGRYTDLEGKSACERCPLGAFANVTGQIACTQCKGSFTTEYPGSDLPAGCACPEGTYHDVTTRMECSRCLEGMTCAFGAQSNFSGNGTVPVLQPTFYTEVQRPLHVYRCLGSEGCPGGQPGQCSNGRVGLVCALCPDTQILRDDLCEDCKSIDTTTFVCVAAAFVSALIVMYHLANDRLTSDVSNALALSVTVGMMVTIIQLMATFSQLPLPWPADVNSVLMACTFMIFDPSSVATECIFGSAPTSKYTLRVLAPYLIVLSVLLLCALTKLLPAGGVWKGKLMPWTLNKTLNTIGAALQAVFVAFAAIASAAFQCYTHPNGDQSIVTYPQVICGSSAHVTLSVMSSLLIVTFIAPFLAMTFWANWTAPRKSVDQDMSHLVRYRFLFYRFRPSMWWWGSSIAVRQLLLAFTPMVQPDDPYAQIMYTLTVLLIYIAAASFTWPWKSHELNLVEITSLVFMTLFLSVISAFVLRTTRSEVYSAVMLTAVFLMVLTKAIAIVAAMIGIMMHGFSGIFGIQYKATHKQRLELAQNWHQFCQDYASLNHAEIANMLAFMNSFDRYQLSRILSITYAVNTDLLLTLPTSSAWRNGTLSVRSRIANITTGAGERQLYLNDPSAGSVSASVEDFWSEVMAKTSSSRQLSREISETADKLEGEKMYADPFKDDALAPTESHSEILSSFRNGTPASAPRTPRDGPSTPNGPSTPRADMFRQGLV